MNGGEPNRPKSQQQPRREDAALAKPERRRGPQSDKEPQQHTRRDTKQMPQQKRRDKPLPTPPLSIPQQQIASTSKTVLTVDENVVVPKTTTVSTNERPAATGQQQANVSRVDSSKTTEQKPTAAIATTAEKVNRPKDDAENARLVVEHDKELKALRARHNKELKDLRNENMTTVRQLRVDLDNAKAKNTALIERIRAAERETLVIKRQLAENQTVTSSVIADRDYQLTMLQTKHNVLHVEFDKLRQIVAAHDTQEDASAVQEAKIRSLSEENASLRAEHETAVQGLLAENEKVRSELQTAAKGLQAKHDVAMKGIRAEHEAALRRLRAEHTATIEAVNAKNKSHLQSLQVDHEAAVSVLRKEYESAIQKMRETDKSVQANHETATKKMRAEHEALINVLRDKERKSAMAEMDRIQEQHRTEVERLEQQLNAMVYV